MPRRSSASYLGPVIPGERPPTPPPEHLSLAAREIWQSIADMLPVERVTGADFTLLSPLLATHLRFAEFLGDKIEGQLADSAVLDDKAKCKHLRSLLVAHAQQSERIQRLCTGLRLTSQSRYTPASRAVVRSFSGPPPWEDWSNGDEDEEEPPKAS